MLSADAAVKIAQDIIAIHQNKQERLKIIREYLKDSYSWDEDLTRGRRAAFLPRGVPNQVKRLLDMSRVNMLRFVVRSAVQVLYVNGYRTRLAPDNETIWTEGWQPNQMDMRQIGIHRAALSYGEAFATVLPATGVSRVQFRGVSPRHMTAVWADDDVWPQYAVEKRKWGWRLYDATHVYDLRPTDRDRAQRDQDFAATRDNPDTHSKLELARDPLAHGAGVCPVVWYRDTDDLDDPVVGLVQPLLRLQDQIDFTTFGLLVSQHFGAFRQRWAIGWVAEDESELIKVSQAQLMTWDAPPSEMQVGEFKETDLSGYLNSRDATLRHLATVSQTSAYELLGQLIQMSAEALVAAQASAQRAASEYRTVLGESHEQLLWLGGKLLGETPDPTAEVRWKDTEGHSLAQLADAFGKLAAQLEIPPQELWPHVADQLNLSQTTVEQWKEAWEERSAELQLQQRLDRQLNGGVGGSTGPGGNAA